MEKKTVLTIFGGTGMEYYAGCRLFCDIMDAIDKEKYDVVKIGITPEGKWLWTNAEPAEIKDGEQWMKRDDNTPAYIVPEEGGQKVLILEGDGYRTEHIDIAFPLIAGYGGEDGRIQGMLDMSGIPYVGSGMLSSAVSLDKEYTYIFAKLCGLKTPKSQVLHKKEYDELKDDIDKLLTIDYPVFIKPANGGTSVGIGRATNKEELLSTLDLAFKYDRKVLVEEHISGSEVKVSLLGNDDPEIGAICEIVLPEGAINDYETKKNYISKKTIPADFDEELNEEIRRQSRLIYKGLDCKGMARIDFFLTKDRELYFNEVNTIPGMGTHSIYSQMFEAVGMEYKTMVQTMLDTAENASLAVFDVKRG